MKGSMKDVAVNSRYMMVKCVKGVTGHPSEQKEDVEDGEGQPSEEHDGHVQEQHEVRGQGGQREV